MKKKYIILWILIICLITETLFICVHFVQNRKMNNVFTSSSINDLSALLDDQLLQDTCESIEQAIIDNMGVKYKVENFRYYFDLVYPNMRTESDMTKGIYVRVEVAFERTGITNSKNDPYYLGYLEGIEQETNTERIAGLKNAAEDMNYYFDAEYGHTELSYYNVYVCYDTSELGMYGTNVITEYSLMCSPNLEGNIEELILFEERYPQISYDEWKEYGKKTALGQQTKILEMVP